MRGFLSVCVLLAAQAAIAGADETPAQVAAAINLELKQIWQDQQIVPHAEIDDLGMLRRLSLDLTGRLPTIEQIDQFGQNTSPHRREQLIEQLLASDAYAEHWSEYWFNVLIGRLTREAFIDRMGFQNWLKEEFAGNRGWSQIATELVTAEGFNSQRRPAGATADPPDWEARYAPATNWFLRYSRSLPDFSGAVAKDLLGLQIQCAQCHDHPTESWKQKDFDQFTALFATTWPAYFDNGFVVGTLRLETKERRLPPPVAGKFGEYFSSYAPYIAFRPRNLGETTELGRFQTRRDRFADWMTAPGNPLLARAFVNRMWKEMLGRGFVEPVDDLRPSNPPLLPALLDRLTQDFVAHDYDIRRLLTIICLSDAYNRGCGEPYTPVDQPPYWSAYPIKNLRVETFYDIVLQATGSGTYLERMTKGRPELLRNAFVRQFVTEVGTDEMTEADEFGETVPRALMQLNGALITGLTRDLPGLTLADVLKISEPEERIELLYLRTLSRKPTRDETREWLDYVGRRDHVASSPGPTSHIPQGLAATRMSPGLMSSPSSDFRELLAEAKTGADFKMLAGKMENNADAGLFAKAFEAWVVEAPFQYLIAQAGATTPEAQAYEDLFWALVSCSEFLTNH